MKITIVFDGLATGGITRVGAAYANMFANHGNSVSVINLTPKKNDMKDAFVPSIEITDFNYPRNLVYQRYSSLHIYGLIGIIASLGLSLATAFASMFLKLYCRIKLRSLSDTDILVAFAGHYNDLGFVANGFIRSKARVTWIHGSEFEYRMISDGFFSLFRKIKNIVCLSEQCDIVCRKFNEANKINKIKIYNPIDLSGNAVSMGKVTELRERYGRFGLMVGRLGEDKDQKTAIEAVRLLNEKYGVGMKLLLAGDGPKRKEIEEYVKSIEMEGSVVLLGNCTDVQNYYSAAEVFIHSSPLEGLPTVLLEAMYYGIPIAATDSFPGVREILENEKYGLISDVYDPAGLMENVYRLISDRELARGFVEAGSERLKVFSPDETEKKAIGFFRSLL